MDGTAGSDPLNVYRDGYTTWKIVVQPSDLDSRNSNDNFLHNNCYYLLK